MPPNDDPLEGFRGRTLTTTEQFMENMLAEGFSTDRAALITLGDQVETWVREDPVARYLISAILQDTMLAAEDLLLSDDPGSDQARQSHDQFRRGHMLLEHIQEILAEYHDEVRRLRAEEEAGVEDTEPTMPGTVPRTPGEPNEV